MRSKEELAAYQREYYKKNREYIRERSRRYYKKNRKKAVEWAVLSRERAVADGRCASCRQPRDADGSDYRCSKCLADMNSRNRSMYAERRANGLCLTCGFAAAIKKNGTRHSYCEYHRKKQLERLRRAYQDKKQ